ncbi:hypothetical protein Pcinc_043691 [Petrolisthes cinctipes]|uniref:Uncharacterized protein n=1 Tax=Petrolisthes cinctipes TaxID=88211 RepID=A0AAE1BFI2_PETCI|nr:hypothetical protein Pcinc_043691 [Petrolisthes cinctipes]
MSGVPSSSGGGTEGVVVVVSSNNNNNINNNNSEGGGVVGSPGTFPPFYPVMTYPGAWYPNTGAPITWGGASSTWNPATMGYPMPPSSQPWSGQQQQQQQHHQQHIQQQQQQQQQHQQQRHQNTLTSLPNPMPTHIPISSITPNTTDASSNVLPQDEYTVDTLRRVYNDNDGRVEIQRVKVLRRHQKHQHHQQESPGGVPLGVVPAGPEVMSVVPITSFPLNERRPPPRKNRKTQLPAVHLVSSTASSTQPQQPPGTTGGPYPWYPSYMPYMPYPYPYPYYMGGCVWPPCMPQQQQQQQQQQTSSLSNWSGGNESERTCSRQGSLPATMDSQRLDSRASHPSHSSLAHSPSPSHTTDLHSLAPSDSVSMRGLKGHLVLEQVLRGPTPPPRARSRASSNFKSSEVGKTPEWMIGLQQAFATRADVASEGNTSFKTAPSDVIIYKKIPPARKRRKKKRDNLSGSRDDMESISDIQSVVSDVTFDESIKLSSELTYAFRKLERSVDAFKTEISIDSSSSPLPSPTPSPSLEIMSLSGNVTPTERHNNNTELPPTSDIALMLTNTEYLPSCHSPVPLSHSPYPPVTSSYSPVPSSNPPHSHVTSSYPPVPSSNPPHPHVTSSYPPVPSSNPPHPHVTSSYPPVPSSNPPHPHVTSSYPPVPSSNPPHSHVSFSHSPVPSSHPPHPPPPPPPSHVQLSPTTTTTTNTNSSETAQDGGSQTPSTSTTTSSDTTQSSVVISALGDREHVLPQAETSRAKQGQIEDSRSKQDQSEESRSKQGQSEDSRSKQGQSEDSRNKQGQSEDSRSKQDLIEPKTTTTKKVTIARDENKMDEEEKEEEEGKIKRKAPPPPPLSPLPGILTTVGKHDNRERRETEDGITRITEAAITTGTRDNREARETEDEATGAIKVQLTERNTLKTTAATEAQTTTTTATEAKPTTDNRKTTDEAARVINGRITTTKQQQHDITTDGSTVPTNRQTATDGGRESRVSCTTNSSSPSSFFSVLQPPDDTDSTDIQLPTTDFTTSDEQEAQQATQQQWVLQGPGDTPLLTSSLHPTQAWRAEVSLWRARLVVSLCRGEGLDRQDWATFHLLVHHPLTLDLKLSLLHAPRLCAANNNGSTGVSVLRVAALHLAQYGEVLLQPEAARHTGWRTISLDNQQQHHHQQQHQLQHQQQHPWSAVKGAVEILISLGYLLEEDTGTLQYPRRGGGVPDVSVVARLTLDLLVLGEELRLFLTGTHQYPTNISNLFLPGSPTSQLIGQDIPHRPPSSIDTFISATSETLTGPPGIIMRPESRASITTDDDTDTLQASVRQVEDHQRKMISKQKSSSEDEVTLKEDLNEKVQAKMDVCETVTETEVGQHVTTQQQQPQLQQQPQPQPSTAAAAMKQQHSEALHPSPTPPDDTTSHNTTNNMTSLPDLTAIASTTTTTTSSTSELPNRVSLAASSNDTVTPKVSPSSTPVHTTPTIGPTTDNPEEHIYEEIDVIKAQVQALRSSSVPNDTPPPPLPPKKKISSGGDDDSSLSLTYPKMEVISMSGSLRGGSTGARRKKRRAPMPPEFMAPDWKQTQQTKLMESDNNQQQQQQTAEAHNTNDNDDGKKDEYRRSLNPFYEEIESKEENTSTKDHNNDINKSKDDVVDDVRDKESDGNPFLGKNVSVAGYVGKNPFYEDVDLLRKSSEKQDTTNSNDGTSLEQSGSSVCAMGSLSQLQEECVVVRPKRRAPRPPPTPQPSEQKSEAAPQQDGLSQVVAATHTKSLPASETHIGNSTTSSQEVNNPNGEPEHQESLHQTKDSQNKSESCNDINIPTNKIGEEKHVSDNINNKTKENTVTTSLKTETTDSETKNVSLEKVVSQSNPMSVSDMITDNREVTVPSLLKNAEDEKTSEETKQTPAAILSKAPQPPPPPQQQQSLSYYKPEDISTPNNTTTTLTTSSSVTQPPNNTTTTLTTSSSVTQPPNNTTTTLTTSSSVTQPPNNTTPLTTSSSVTQPPNNITTTKPSEPAKLLDEIPYMNENEVKYARAKKLPLHQQRYTKREAPKVPLPTVSSTPSNQTTPLLGNNTGKVPFIDDSDLPPDCPPPLPPETPHTSPPATPHTSPPATPHTSPPTTPHTSPPETPNTSPPSTPPPLDSSFVVPRRSPPPIPGPSPTPTSPLLCKAPPRPTTTTPTATATAAASTTTDQEKKIKESINSNASTQPPPSPTSVPLRGSIQDRVPATTLMDKNDTKNPRAPTPPNRLNKQQHNTLPSGPNHSATQNRSTMSEERYEIPDTSRAPPPTPPPPPKPNPPAPPSPEPQPKSKTSYTSPSEAPKDATKVPEVEERYEIPEVVKGAVQVKKGVNGTPWMCVRDDVDIVGAISSPRGRRGGNMEAVFGPPRPPSRRRHHRHPYPQTPPPRPPKSANLLLLTERVAAGTSSSFSPKPSSDIFTNTTTTTTNNKNNNTFCSSSKGTTASSPNNNTFCSSSKGTTASSANKNTFCSSSKGTTASSTNTSSSTSSSSSCRRHSHKDTVVSHHLQKPKRRSWPFLSLCDCLYVNCRSYDDVK